jgi:hypothetical protein
MVNLRKNVKSSLTKTFQRDIIIKSSGIRAFSSVWTLQSQKRGASGIFFIGTVLTVGGEVGMARQDQPACVSGGGKTGAGTARRLGRPVCGLSGL